MNFLKVELSMDEAHMVVNALAQLPYHQVFMLINKLQVAAQPPAPEPAKEPDNGASEG